MSSWERHLTFQEMLQDTEPVEDIDLTSLEMEEAEENERIEAYKKDGGY